MLETLADPNTYRGGWAASMNHPLWFSSHTPTSYQNKKPPFRVVICFGGRLWIRTTEVSDNRFTVCPLWPLGKSPWSWWTESNPRPTDYKSVALPAELHQHFQVVACSRSATFSVYSFQVIMSSPFFQKFKKFLNFVR